MVIIEFICMPKRLFAILLLQCHCLFFNGVVFPLEELERLLYINQIRRTISGKLRFQIWKCVGHLVRHSSETHLYTYEYIVLCILD